MKALSMMVAAALLVPGMVSANDMGKSDASSKPKTWEERRVQSNAQDATIQAQKLKETKAALEQAQKDLASAQSQDPKVREEAQDRVKSLQKKYDRLAKQVADEKQDLREAKQEVAEEKAEDAAKQSEKATH
jgi:hypothetical protein